MLPVYCAAARMTPFARDVIAGGFGVFPRAVERDAELLRAWSGPADDLLALLERARRWSAGVAVRYLAALSAADAV